MPTRKQPPQDDTDKQAAQEAYEGFFERALSEPMRYLKHESNAHDDDELYRMVHDNGMAYYGWYWLLVELLVGRRYHYYDVSDDAGWRRLAHDMSCMRDMSVDDCKTFVNELYNYDLINREQLTELSRLTITHILVDANDYAKEVARKQLGAWKTNRKREGV